MARYLVSDLPSEDHNHTNHLWHHLFERGGGDTPVRFVFDTELQEMVAAFVPDDTDGTGWAELSSDLAHDVQESLIDNLGLAESAPHIYPDANFLLVETDEVPDWADVPTTKPSRLPSP